MKKESFDIFCQLLQPAAELAILTQFEKYIPESAVDDGAWDAYTEDLRAAINDLTHKHFGGIVNG